MLTRPEGRSPRQPRKRSDPEQPEITFGWEAFGDMVREARPLLAREHAEVQTDKRFVFDPDWERFFGWSQAGSMDVWTVRADGVLIGYASVLFMPCLYSRELFMANVQTPYLVPEWRLGRLGMEMLDTLEAALRERSVQMVDFVIDTGSRVHKLLERKGYAAAEVTRRKFL